MVTYLNLKFNCILNKIDNDNVGCPTERIYICNGHLTAGQQIEELVSMIMVNNV